MILCNFSNTDYSLNWYDSKWGNLNNYLEGKTDGIELLLHGNYNVSNIPENTVKGLHLSYFPTWLNSYNNDEKYREDIIDKYKKEFKIAKKLKVKYMVFHISHVELKDAFYFKYDYTNLDVINGVIDIVNSVFSENSEIELLFENLWWPGLTLLSKEELDYLIDNINYKNSGVMLDLSHLIVTNKNIKNIEEGTDYIIDTVNNLGTSSKHIKGLHINYTDSNEYLNICHKSKYKDFLNEEDDIKKMNIVYTHIGNIDSHKPFNSKSLNKIIDLIKPKYKVIELIGNNKTQWEEYLEDQLKYIEVRKCEK